MSKKLICVLISLIFILSAVLTGCSGSKSTEEEENGTSNNTASTTTVRRPMTLSLWLPTDESTTEDAVKKVEEQLNKIAEQKYMTHIELHAISDSEYQEVIDAKINGIADVKNRIADEAEQRRLKQIELAKQGKTLDEYDAEQTESDAENEDPKEESSDYPEVKEDQLDIFLIRGYENYMNYIDNELVESLDTELNTNSRLLRTFIYPTFLECVNQGGVYAIPNNHVIGEYQLLLINKELCEKYDYDIDEMETLKDCRDFILDIGSMDLDGVVPFLGEVDAGNLVFFSSDGNWSLLGDRIISDYSYKTTVEFSSSILDIPEVYDSILLMKQLKEKGYLGNGTVKEGETFACGVVKGDYTLFDKYGDDYYIKVHACPYADEDDIFKSMFAVSPYTKDVTRSMEIITLLNTDTEFRTILQYGAEGVNWEYDPLNPDVINQLKNDYKMNIEDTGNIFITYPDFGKPISDWGDKDHGAKKQNLDSATSPFIGFEPVDEANKDAYAQLATLSAQTKAKVDAMTYEEAKSGMGSLRLSLAMNELMLNMMDDKNSEIEDCFAIMYTSYAKSKR